MIRLRPLFLYDPAMEQAWLEDQAAKGRFVYEYKSLYACFWHEEPKTHVRFRLEPARDDTDRPDMQTQETYLEMGWKYVCSIDRSYRVWRCDDPKAPELNTDPQVQAAGYDYLQRKSQKTVRFLVGFWAVVLAILLVFNLLLDDYFIREVESWRPMVIWLPRMGALLGMALVLTFAAWRRKVYLKVLEAGVPQPHRKPYRLSQWMMLMMLVLEWAFLLSLAAGVLYGNTPYRPQSFYEEPIPAVEMPELMEVEAIRWQNWHTREQWWTIQSDYEKNGLPAQGKYYDFYLPWEAGRMAKQLAKRDGLPPLETPLAEDAWYLEADEWGFQNLLLRKGGRVVFMEYKGTENLLDNLNAFADLLN